MKYLIVIDMQNDFFDGTLACDKDNLIYEYTKAKINEFDGEVLYTQDTHFDDYLSTYEGKQIPIKHCIKGSFGWQIKDGLYKKGSKIFEKHQFSSLKLIKYLQSAKNIKSLELIGICTDICVLNNAILLRSYFNEIDIIIDAKACVGTSIKAHKNTLELLKSNGIKIINN